MKKNKILYMNLKKNGKFQNNIQRFFTHFL